MRRRRDSNPHTLAWDTVYETVALSIKLRRHKWPLREKGSGSRQTPSVYVLFFFPFFPVLFFADFFPALLPPA